MGLAHRSIRSPWRLLLYAAACGAGLLERCGPLPAMVRCLASRFKAFARFCFCLRIPRSLSALMSISCGLKGYG